ncbi:hypothetical protein [Agathobacter rectalis]|jgi:hypothetical protein|uniref:Transposase n=1 Tax=Agathobacter rectalis TaxID=39491 RepID=A0A413LZ93_9FIRM|nr:hypothetical protein [Agathobacter rectalis]MSC61284.1 hypothetical protein [Agathobacter rectalis]RGZ12051.1 hypothetical protein DXA03_16320 [Agathobacter rectalis]
MNNDKQQILIDCVNGFKEISRHERYGAMCIRFLSQQWRYWVRKLGKKRINFLSKSMFLA